MKNLKKVLSLLVAVATVLAMCGMLSACKDEGGNGDTLGGANTTYTVKVKSQGGLCLDGISVEVYEKDNLSDLKGFNETNEDGVATIELPEKDSYVVKLSSVPKGYSMEETYPLTANTVITLSSSLIMGEDISTATLGLGDVMYDFTVTTPDGTELTLSKMLEEKKMVLLNFWYIGCSACTSEFPYMQEAYEMYQDKVGIIAVDPLQQGNEAIAAYPASYGMELTFPMAECPYSWKAVFPVGGEYYPTSVFIDRYGVIVLIEVGGMPSLRPFTSIFEKLTADDYTQVLYNEAQDALTEQLPLYEMDTPENVSAIMGSSDLPIVYHPKTEGTRVEYAWPFIEAEKNGVKCLKASNSGYDDSHAILYAEVELKKGQAFGFDYLSSSEAGNDTLYVNVNDESINTISGYNEEEKWESCYPVVADHDGTYEVVFIYLKDSSDSAGDDTVYIKNARIVDENDIDTVTYLPKHAAVTDDEINYEYVDIYYNSKDTYYHVGSENGPLLLANLMNASQFSEDNSVWNMASDGEIVVDGKDYLEELTVYCAHAANSQLNGYCTVNQELYELLQKVDEAAGFDDADTNEWLKLCKYYAAYGTDKQLEDPIAGLASFSAYTAKVGKNVASNYFYYNRVIMPRGLFAKFVPTKSGAYRITSHNESQQGVDGWIFGEDENGKLVELLCHEPGERMYDSLTEISMVYYMEAGKPYYINIAFFDLYEVGYIYYDLEYMGATYDYFTLCSQSYFTYDTDASGSAMYHTISGGIDVVLGDDGYYYHDLGNGKKGSKIYADFIGTTIFDDTIASYGTYKGLIDKGAFDFTKDEGDQIVLTAMAQNDNDPDKTTEWLKEYWAEHFESYYELYQVDDVYNGIYHGEGKDMTEVARKYLNKMITGGKEELEGCVAVNEELAEILQMLMDKFTFEGVENSWLKLCYYYDYMGR